MIRLRISGSLIEASGLIPGEDIELTLNGSVYIVHRHGPECHAHLLKGENDADTRETSHPETDKT